jgi:hypothetical protein
VKGRTLNEESISRIDVLYSVAKLNDSALSLRDLSALLSAETSVTEIEEAFANSPTLRSKYMLHSGYVVEKDRSSAAAAELQKRRQALGNVVMGAQLASRLKGRGALVIAIGGSTSYESVKASDDLDFFCVTGVDNAWIFLTKALLLLRASRLTSHGASKACLSCVMDQRYAEAAFGREQDPLFARDALNALVLEGEGEYTSLLLKADWMRKMFPRLYAVRSGPPSMSADTDRRSVAGRVANRFLFYAVGTYLRIKCMLENRQLRRRRADRGRLFETRIGSDHCIYESTRYRQMREIYKELGRRQPSPQQSTLSR